MVRAGKVADIFAGSTPPTAGTEEAPKPDLAKEAEEAEERAEAEERGEIEPMPGQRAKPAAISGAPKGSDGKTAVFDVPELPAQEPKNKKVWFFVPTTDANDLERLIRYAAFHYGLKQHEVQTIALRVGLDNQAEIMRALRVKVGLEEAEED